MLMTVHYDDPVKQVCLAHIQLSNLPALMWHHREIPPPCGSPNNHDHPTILTPLTPLSCLQVPSLSPGQKSKYTVLNPSPARREGGGEEGRKAGGAGAAKLDNVPEPKSTLYRRDQVQNTALVFTPSMSIFIPSTVKKTEESVTTLSTEPCI